MKNRIHPQTLHAILIKGFAIASILALFFLVAGLPYLDFQPGQAMIIQEKGLTLKPIKIQFYPSLLASICLSSMLMTVPALVILLIFSSEARKLFKKYARAVILCLIFFIVFRLYSALSGTDSVVDEPLSTPPAIPESLNSLSSIEVGSEQAAEYTPPEVTGWFGYLIGFFSILMLGIIFYILWESHRTQRNELGFITLKALKDISSGRQWEDAVIECYAQMNAVVSHQRKLDRELAMTPTEFSQKLIATGLPSEPVIQLTHLFEQARYGRRSSQSGEAQQAVRCLTAIKLALGSEN